MPTYDYECGACHHTFEMFQSMSAKPLRRCPSCGKSKLQRLIGAGAGLIFKGSGFYITDYRSEGYKSAAKKDSGSGDGGTKGTGANGASKDGGTKAKAAPKTD